MIGSKVSLKHLDVDNKSQEPVLLGTVTGTIPWHDGDLIEVEFVDKTKGIFGLTRDEIDGIPDTPAACGVCASDVLEDTGRIVDEAVDHYAGALLLVMD